MHRWFGILVVALLASALPAQDVRYRLKPVVRDGLTELHVTMSFVGSRAGCTIVALPNDRFGVPAMYRFASDIAPSSPSISITRSDDSTLQVIHPRGARIAFSYKIRFDSAPAGFVAFGPSVGPRHYHVLGSQWMARVGRRDTILSYSVEIQPGDLGGTTRARSASPPTNSASPPASTTSSGPSRQGAPIAPTTSRARAGRW
jgi:hypothetical protein